MKQEREVIRVRQIVNKKMYDTEKALLIAGNWKDGLEENNAIATSEDLYITSKGQFFLHCCSGQPITQYAETNGKESWGSERIVPLDKNETYQWLEKNNEVEVIEKYFSDYVEEA